MKHSIPHDLSVAVAKKAVENAIADYSEKLASFSPSANWVSERVLKIHFRVKGMALNGQLSVGDTSIDLELKLPFIFRPFRDRSIQVIDREVCKWIDRGRRGELD